MTVLSKRDLDNPGLHPFHRRLSFVTQVRVSFFEMPTTAKLLSCKGAGVAVTQNKVPFVFRNERSVSYGVSSPQHEAQSTSSVAHGQGLYQVGRELAPEPQVGSCSAVPHGECSIQHQHSLVGPITKVATRALDAVLSFYL